MGGLQLKRALEAIGGDSRTASDSREPFAKRNSLILLEGRFGSMSTAIQSRNIYVRKVERVGGRLRIQSSYRHSRACRSSGPYKPDEYLKNPVYDQELPTL